MGNDDPPQQDYAIESPCRPKRPYMFWTLRACCFACRVAFWRRYIARWLPSLSARTRALMESELMSTSWPVLCGCIACAACWQAAAPRCRHSSNRRARGELRLVRGGGASLGAVINARPLCRLQNLSELLPQSGFLGKGGQSAGRGYASQCNRPTALLHALRTRQN